VATRSGSGLYRGARIICAVSKQKTEAQEEALISLHLAEENTGRARKNTSLHRLFFLLGVSLLLALQN
jgi:hypothetical protein